MNLRNPTGDGCGRIRTTPWQVIGVGGGSYRQRGRGARRRGGGQAQVERKKKTTSTASVPPISQIPNRYLGRAPSGLASWDGSVGSGLVSVSFIFSTSYSFSIFCFAF
jgi:hypothetical protein